MSNEKKENLIHLKVEKDGNSITVTEENPTGLKYAWKGNSLHIYGIPEQIDTLRMDFPEGIT